MTLLPTNHADATATSREVITAAIVNDIATALNGLAIAVAAPSGVAATDSALFAGLTTGYSYQLQPGTYIINPTTISTSNVQFVGTSRLRTTIKLAGQSSGANVSAITCAATGVTFDGITFDGNSSTIGSGVISGPGLIEINGGSNDCTVRNCLFQNTGGTAIYAFGYQGTQTYRLRVESCQFTSIGRSGAANGGCCVMLDGGINDAKILNNRAYGTLTSNFLKVKVNTSVNCIGTLVQGNTVDYSSCTTFDGTNSALGIELWNGSYYSRIIGNYIIGPNTVPVAGACWGISLGDARYSTISGNVVQGGTSAQAMAYGIETGECPYVTISGNTVKNVDIGTNATNNNPIPSHGQTIVGNVYDTCYTNAITTDSGPSGIKIIGNTFVDCGDIFVFLNSTNAITRQALIQGNTFLIRDQVRTHASDGVIYGVYVIGTARTDVCPVDIIDNYFGPHPSGTGTKGMLAIAVNNPQGVRILDNHMDGGRPSDGVAEAPRALNGDCYQVTFRGNKLKNMVTEAGYADGAQINVVENNDWGSLAFTRLVPTAAAGANAGASPPAPVVVTTASPRSGNLTFGTGTGPAAGAQAVVTFQFRTLVAPNVTLSALNTATQALGLYVSSVTNAGFTVSCTTAPSASQANTVYGVSWLALTI